jgi:hypothetical protein
VERNFGEQTETEGVVTWRRHQKLTFREDRFGQEA